MKQTGLLIRAPYPMDYIAGAETAIIDEVRLTDGNWKDYLPTNEKQHAPTFDTMSCVSFSALNTIETQLNYLMSSLPHRDWLEKSGYIEDGKFNCSDRFIAILSGTTKQGNYLNTVAETIRKVGLIPEKDFPMGGTNWEEYHDPRNITEAMKAKGLEFLERFTFLYDWVFFDNNPDFTQDQRDASAKALKTAPLQVGIPVPAQHALTMFSLSTKPDLFDSYDPFVREQDPKSLHFGMRIVVHPKETPPKLDYPKYVFTKYLVKGVRSEEVKMLQQVLIAEGFLKTGLDTGFFWNLTEQGVKSFQAKWGIEVVGKVGPITRRRLNILCK